MMSVVVGLQSPATLITFDTAHPATLLSTTKVRGLAKRESLLGIDYRPADNKLYATGSSNRLYTIDLATGDATPIGATTFAVPLNGTSFGFDFNPVADRGRIVSEANQNARIDPNDGTIVDVNIDVTGVQIDPDLAYASGDVHAGADPAVISSAFTNSDTDGGTDTRLYQIDASQDVLALQGSIDGSVSSNTGQLFTVGSLGIDVAPSGGGFDIETAGGTNTAYAVLTTNTRQPPQLYSINLDTGAATSFGNVGRNKKPVIGITVAPQGTPFFIVTQKNELMQFNTATPSLILSQKKITGFVNRRENVTGIDVRPATGQLYAMTDAGRLYTVEPTGAIATPVGGVSAVTLEARKTFYGFDINPAADRVRVVNSAGQNVRFDPSTGAAIDFDPSDLDTDPDTGLAYVPGDANNGRNPRIVAAAYSTNTPGGTPTTLYAIDSSRDVLATQGSISGTPTSPNTGQLFTVGAAGLNVPDQIGFDIRTTGGSNAAFAVFAPGNRGTTGLYSVDLGTGAMTLAASLNKKVKHVVGFALPIGS